MKRLLFFVLCCLLIMSAALPSAAEGLNEEMVRVVNDNLDNFFPLSSISEGFAAKSQPVRGNIGPETATEFSTGGTRNILLYANPDGTSQYVLEEKVNAGNLRNFYYELDVIPNDIYPTGEGGCYIGYVNEFIPGISAEEPVSPTMLVVSDGIYLESGGVDSKPGTREKLADFSGGQTKLRIIRLTGETLFYADGELIGVFHDGQTGPFQLRFGSETFTNGEIADCSFDNLAVRKVVP